MTEYIVTKRQLIAELSDICRRIAEFEEPEIDYRYQNPLLENLLLSLPAAIYVTVDGIFKFISPQFRQITGRPESELIETSTLNIFLQEDKDIAREHLMKALRNGGSLAQEFRIITKNADIKWIMQASSPITYEGRRAVVAIVVDITERKRAEEALRGVEDRYRDLCENSNDMIQCIAPDGRILYANRACREALGYSEDEIIRLSLFEIMPRDYVEYCLEEFQKVISGESISNFEALFINKDGHRITVEGNINCHYVDGKPMYLRGIFRDIIDRKRAQEETEALIEEVQEINRRLQLSNQELEDFARIASHDLQEPLRKISSFGGLLQASLEGKIDEDQIENLGFIIDGARRMQLMIDDLLSYSRITTRAKPFESVDPNNVIENLRNFELAAALDETKGNIHIPEPLPAINGDPSQIHQLLQNLISNGLKFHCDVVSPTITISSHPAPKGMIHFNIQDNGIGIKEEYHEQIFIMFKRLNSRDSYKGTGIGLAICKKIVERHGGQIGVKSKPNEGSTFWFTLPRFGPTITTAQEAVINE